MKSPPEFRYKIIQGNSSAFVEEQVNTILKLDNGWKCLGPVQLFVIKCQYDDEEYWHQTLVSSGRIVVPRPFNPLDRHVKTYYE